jgi:acyl-CoA synthetase (AMP-forming)/AMP-acid ligase II
MPTFEVQTFLHAITEERIDLLTSVPAVFWLAMNQPSFRDLNTAGVRWLSYGGAPIASDLVGRLVEAFPNARVGNGFGLTETASVATFLPHEYARARPETVGLAAPVVDLDLFEVDRDTGVGELLVRGPNVIKGYWNKPRETAEAVVDGWLHTGDLARIDSDGFVQIVDRKKDMINRGGENVYCVEVENAIASHPAVFEVAVVGIPDSMMGEKVGAVIQPKPGVQMDPGEVVSFLRGKIADFKIPQYVAFRTQPLPRNAGGKVLKAIVRKETDWGRPLR